MVACQDRDAVRTNLIGHVTVCRYPVGAHHDFVYPARAHEVSRHTVGDERCGYPLLLKLPGREARPLAERPGLVHIDMDAFALFHRRPHHSKGRAVSHTCKRARIAVREDAVTALDECGTRLPEAPVRPHVLLCDALRFLTEGGNGFEGCGGSQENVPLPVHAPR